MRQFSLTNGSGETYRLNSLDNFFHDPKGLGFSRKTEYQKIGNTFEILDDSVEQKAIQGSIMFKDSKSNPAYNKYLKFAEFLQTWPLTLHYRAAKGDEYKLDVVPSEVNKTEITSALGLDVEITLTSLSLWYRTIEQSATGTSITVRSDSMLESPCHVMFTPSASITALTWTHTIGNTTITTGGLSNIEVSSSQAVHVRTDTDPYEIYRSGGGSNVDYYGKSDFSKPRFIMLQKGNNVITFNTSGSITVEGRILYETV